MNVRRKGRVNAPVVPSRANQPVMMASYIQDTMNWQAWRGRAVTLRTASAMVAADEAEVVTRRTANGIITFFRETKPARASESSPTTLTMATMHAVARSEEHLTPGEKAHVLKFRVWALIGDTKAVTVRPRISAEERKLAESLLGGKAA